jgi:hypothetical protein
MRPIAKSYSNVISHLLQSIPVEGEYRLSKNEILTGGGRSPKVPASEAAKFFWLYLSWSHHRGFSSGQMIILGLAKMNYLHAHPLSPLQFYLSPLP